MSTGFDYEGHGYRHATCRDCDATGMTDTGALDCGCDHDDEDDDDEEEEEAR